VNFRTEILPSSSGNRISHTSEMMLVGSCFAESIGDKLLYFKFPVLINPFGILFNPISISNAIRFITEKKLFTENDLVCYDGLWHSFFHHGSFSNANKDVCLEIINRSIVDAHEWLKKTKTIIITLGTAYVWEYKNGLVVSNCHKIPSNDFKQYMLSPTQVQDSLQLILDSIKKVNRQGSIVFTVSPIRYMNHGVHQSQLSKATLLLAINNIQKENPDIDYFPSYELMMDDLRDYRFYAEDMIHPSAQAIDYIWDKFSESYFDNETIDLNQKIDAYQKAKAHRILNPESKSGEKFINHISALRNNLCKTYPFLNL